MPIDLQDFFMGTFQNQSKWLTFLGELKYSTGFILRTGYWILSMPLGLMSSGFSLWKSFAFNLLRSNYLFWFEVWNVFVVNLSINNSTSKYRQFSSTLNHSQIKNLNLNFFTPARFEPCWHESYSALQMCYNDHHIA